MVNYMEEIAKMLGVDIGEEFRTDKCAGPFYFSSDALYDVHNKYQQDGILRALISGAQKIVKYRDIPENGYAFWYVTKNNNAYCELWEGTTFNIMLYKLGNFYKSKAEAEANCDKWSRFYASDEVLEV